VELLYSLDIDTICAYPWTPPYLHKLIWLVFSYQAPYHEDIW